MTREEFVKFVYEFVNERKDKISDKCDFGCSVEELLDEIKNDLNDSPEWTFTELLTWGMDKDYLEQFEVGEMDNCPGDQSIAIYSVDGESYFFMDYSKSIEGVFTPCKKVEKIIEVFERI